MDEQQPKHRWARLLIKWGLCVLVLCFVGDRAVDLWQSDELSQLQLRPGWIVPAILCYLAGWVPSIWFWRMLLAEFGQRPGWLLAVKAYYLGHLGKYVPGKAMAIVLRSAALKPVGCPISVSAVTATVETLAVMGTGLAVWLALAPVSITGDVWNELPAWLQWLRSPVWLAPTLILAAVVPGLVSGSRVMSSLAVRLTPREFQTPAGRADDATPEADEPDNKTVVPANRPIRPRLLLSGFLAFVVAWFAHGLSLGLTLRSVGADSWSLADWPLWTCAVAGATAVGFFAIFAPGGLGVREGLLIATLQSTTGGRAALAAAALLRVLWLVSELLACGLLMLVSRACSGPVQRDRPGQRDESLCP